MRMAPERSEDSTSSVLVDALPYIDHGYDEPGVREAALQLVEEETRVYRPTKNYLDHLPPLDLTSFETEVIRHELGRISARQPLDCLSMRRYELPAPPSGKTSDVAAWSECVDNSMAQLEHQRTRIANLELMLDYGSEAWRRYNETLQTLVKHSQEQLARLKKRIQEVNWARKSKQTGVGEKLSNLENEWVGLVSKNYEIEVAIQKMQEDCNRIRPRN